MEKLGDSLKIRALPQKKKGGAIHEWQDHAVRVAQKLGIKPNPQWFKFFKLAYAKGELGKLQKAYSFVSDANANNPEKLFYWWWYHNIDGRITYETGKTGQQPNKR